MDNYSYIKNMLLQKIRKKYNMDILPGDNGVKVVTILDEFSYNCFKYEGSFYQLGLNNWKGIIDNLKPDFLFVEAAWEGLNKQWTNKISNYSRTSDKTLEKIVKYCELNHIPTVFWAKEDPYDFQVFIDAARLFQYVFTTDENMITKYKGILNHENIYLLPFAAQPKIHNPINKNKDKKGNIVFTGGWYNKFPERCVEMDYLLEGAINYNLTIYDRFYDSKDIKNKFPDKYKQYIVVGLDYLKMVEEYKRFKILLNANSVSDSPTNFSRRVFESLSCGIPVVSPYSLGIENYFKDIVKLVNNKEETQITLRKLLNDRDLADKLSLLGIREIMINHTYRHRLNSILEVLNLDRTPYKTDEGVSVITVTNRKFQLENIIQNFIKQTYPVKELILIINNNSINMEIWKELISFREDIKLFKMDEKFTLGECLNFGVENSTYPYISKFDDDDYYGPNYLLDAINTFKYTDAAIVGKYTVYAYMHGKNDLILRYPGNENKYIDYVAGSTITFKKEIFKTVKFISANRSEDTHFLQEALRQGYKIYSSDRFNHVISRRNNLRTHTWRISEKDFRNKSEFIVKTQDFKEIVYV